jgi:MFS family permease
LVLASIVFFAVGSIVAAVANNFTMMIIGRSIQGIGGGGILTLGEILVTDLVPLSVRGGMCPSLSPPIFCLPLFSLPLFFFFLSSSCLLPFFLNNSPWLISSSLVWILRIYVGDRECDGTFNGRSFRAKSILEVDFLD